MNNDPDKVDPDHYKFPGGVEVRHLSQHLTSFGGQAVQYIARATRLDGNTKGNPVADLEKAVKFLEWEIERLRGSRNAYTVTFKVENAEVITDAIRAD